MKKIITKAKPLSPEKEKEIFEAHFNKGMKRSKIKRKYKINDLQFSQIVRRIIRQESIDKYPQKEVEWVGKINGGWKEIK